MKTEGVRGVRGVRGGQGGSGGVRYTRGVICQKSSLTPLNPLCLGASSLSEGVTGGQGVIVRRGRGSAPGGGQLSLRTLTPHTRGSEGVVGVQICVGGQTDPLTPCVTPYLTPPRGSYDPAFARAYANARTRSRPYFRFEPSPNLWG